MKKQFLLLVSAMLLLSSYSVSAQGFTNYYSPANWTIHLPAPEFGGSVPTFNSNTLVIVGPEGEECISGEEVSVSITIPQPGTVSFDWAFENFDIFGAGFDFFIIRKTPNGTVELLEVTNTSNGSFTENFNTGDILTIAVFSSDCIFGEGIATITNFSAPAAVAVPVSNWALYLGILLILLFTVIRFRKLL